MADISAKDVMALRKKTGIGMMECKKALVEANGDFDEAIKILREKGLSVAAKKADRVTAEGIVDIAKCCDKDVTAMVEVNTETDFVAKNETFKVFVKQILNTILANTINGNQPADLDALLKLNLDGSERTVEEEIKDKIFVIGENISIRRFIVYKGTTGTYIHGGGSAGVVVNFETSEGIEKTELFVEYAKNISMQIAAMGPIYVCKNCVPASVVEEEKEILSTQIKNDEQLSKKPAAVIEKMVTGRIEKFYDTVCLNEQAYVKDDSIKVKDYTDSVAKELGGAIKIVAFTKYERGEGIEKREDNFAEEIDKLVNG